MSDVNLELAEFEQLVRPLRRLKVSHVWEHRIRDGDYASGFRSTANSYKLMGYEDRARVFNDLATKLEVSSERVAFSALTFELGALERMYERSTLQRGQASFHFGTCWRVESPRAIALSNKTDWRMIDEELKLFLGRRVLDVEVTGRLPELVVRFSGKRWIQSFGDCMQPCWHITLLDSTFIHSKNARLVRSGL